MLSKTTVLVSIPPSDESVDAAQTATMIAHDQVVDARMCFAVHDTTPADEIEIEVEVPEEMSAVRSADRSAGFSCTRPYNLAPLTIAKNR